MRAIVFDQFGEEDVLRIGEAPSPRLSSDELRIAVTHAAVNRADLLQRQGHYPPPPGASEILGMECAGEVVEVGEAVTGWKRGDRVMALLPGGGYAEEVTVHAGSAMHVPASLSDEEAAAIPEVFLTAFLNLFLLAEVKSGDWVLLQGGGSGVGTAATSMLKLAGAQVIVTAGSAEKRERCVAHGADFAIDYHDDFAARARELTGGRGVDVILDNIGAPYLGQHVSALAGEGRLVLIGSMGGGKLAELDVSAVLSRRLRIIGSTLRSRPAAEKTALVAAFIARFGDDLANGRLRPIIDRVFPLEEAAEAHRRMKSSAHFGKIVLRVR